MQYASIAVGIHIQVVGIIYADVWSRSVTEVKGRYTVHISEHLRGAVGDQSRGEHLHVELEHLWLGGPEAAGQHHIGYEAVVHHQHCHCVKLAVLGQCGDHKHRLSPLSDAVIYPQHPHFAVALHAQRYLPCDDVAQFACICRVEVYLLEQQAPVAPPELTVGYVVAVVGQPSCKGAQLGCCGKPFGRQFGKLGCPVHLDDGPHDVECTGRQNDSVERILYIYMGQAAQFVAYDNDVACEHRGYDGQQYADNDKQVSIHGCGC